jgi:hypothetical protein
VCNGEEDSHLLIEALFSRLVKHRKRIFFTVWRRRKESGVVVSAENTGVDDEAVLVKR